MPSEIRRTLTAVSLAFALTGVCAGQMESDHSASPQAHNWTGVWQGKLEGKPGVTITLTDDTGALAGTIVFNALDRNTGNIIDIVPRTVLEPRMEGNALAFQVKRIRRPHLKGEEPGTHEAEDDVDIVEMVVTQTSEGKAALTCPKCGGGPATELVKAHAD